MADSSEPRYSIGTVVSQTQVPADTIRAWERRYGVPRPARTGSNRRLYSDADISHILRLRSRDGRSVMPVVPENTVPHAQPSNPADTRDLTAPWSRFDTARADRWFDTLLARSDLASALSSAVTALRALSGPAAVFGREHVRSRLLRLLASYQPVPDASLAFVAGGPSIDEVTALATGVLLARSSWRVLPLLGIGDTDLAAIAATLQPQSILVAGVAPPPGYHAYVIITGTPLPSDPVAALSSILAAQ